MKNTRGKYKSQYKAKVGFLLVGVISLLWLFIRTGKKPSRIRYPCQQVAAVNTAFLFHIPIFSFFCFILRIQQKASKHLSYKRVLALTLTIIIIDIAYQGYQQRPLYASEMGYGPFYLDLSPANATMPNASDIYVVNNRLGNDSGTSDLLNLMDSHNLFFYKSDILAKGKGPKGLIANDDVVLIKINCQWSERGGTNTDLLKGLIQKIVNHPDGFKGEIVVADNGQYRGSMDWDESNAENHIQSTQKVIDLFSNSFNVSTYAWIDITSIEVEEYSNGDMTDGYVLNETANPRTGMKVTYPKFQTVYGTFISFKMGIWYPLNNSYDTEKLKVINVQVLKSHEGYGVTGSVKNYMGVQSQGPGEGWREVQGLGNGHFTVGFGSMGTLMVETRMPTLNILDAIYVNANPYPLSSAGPYTAYEEAARINVIMASIDPVALDYWAARNVLIPTANLIGYNDTSTIDPVTTEKNGLREAFGVWLEKSKDEILLGGYQVTDNEDQMNVYIVTNTTGYQLNLRVLDWDMTEGIQGAKVYKNGEVITSNQQGWANWTRVDGNIQIKIKYFGQWVNDTLLIYVDKNKTINVQCEIFDVVVTCIEQVQNAILQNANVTVFNSTSVFYNRIDSALTTVLGKTILDDMPKGKLTFSVYCGETDIVIANVTRDLTSDQQEEIIVCNQNYVGVSLDFNLLYFVEG